MISGRVSGKLNEIEVTRDTFPGISNTLRMNRTKAEVVKLVSILGDWKEANVKPMFKRDQEDI